MGIFYQEFLFALCNHICLHQLYLMRKMFLPMFKQINNIEHRIGVRKKPYHIEFNNISYEKKT